MENKPLSDMAKFVDSIDPMKPANLMRHVGFVDNGDGTMKIKRPAPCSADLRPDQKEFLQRNGATEYVFVDLDKIPGEGEEKGANMHAEVQSKWPGAIHDPDKSNGKTWAFLLPAKPMTCQHCKHWFDGNQPQGFGSCSQPDIAGYHERGDSKIFLTPPASFGCNLWSPK